MYTFEVPMNMLESAMEIISSLEDGDIYSQFRQNGRLPLAQIKVVGTRMKLVKILHKIFPEKY